MTLITDLCYAKCHKQTHYAECHYAECRYAECRGPIYTSVQVQTPLGVEFEIGLQTQWQILDLETRCQRRTH